MEDEKPIKTHYEDDEILKITLNQELEDWENELKFIEKELEFFMELLGSTSKTQDGETEKNRTDFRNTLDEFIKKNKDFYDKTVNFSNKTMGIRECDDMDCETYFFNEHFDFHNKLSSHLNKTRELKLQLFGFLKDRQSLD